jgi:hypothetical protein
VIGLTHPAALWTLALIAGPVVVHLLRRHRAERVLFPSLRFVRAAETAAIRLRPPSDLWLLLVRAAAVGLAAFALAGPIVLTDVRLARWNALTARAVVVDTSESMRAVASPAASPTRAADEATAAEMRQAAHSIRIDTPDLGEGLRRAAIWLSSAPPARREIVVISDFQRGALHDSAVRAIPDAIGRRLLKVGDSPGPRAIGGRPLLSAFTHGAMARRRSMIDLTADTTTLRLGPVEAGPVGGFRVIGADAGAGEVARLVRVIATAGAAAPSEDEPMAIAFGNTMAAGGQSTLAGGWMLATALGVMRDPVLTDVPSADVAPLSRANASAPYSVVVRRPDGSPIVSAAALGVELVFATNAAPESLFAAALARAALNARSRAQKFDEREIAAIDGDTLKSWQRAPAPVGAGEWRNADRTDARWFWLLSLAALGLEQWLRRRPRQRDQEALRDAA